MASPFQFFHLDGRISIFVQAFCSEGTIENSPAFERLVITHIFWSCLKFSKPSLIHINLCHPRQIVCQPGIPSLLRPINPPSRATATQKVPWVQPAFGLPNPQFLRRIMQCVIQQGRVLNEQILPGFKTRRRCPFPVRF